MRLPNNHFLMRRRPLFLAFRPAIESPLPSPLCLPSLLPSSLFHPSMLLQCVNMQPGDRCANNSHLTSPSSEGLDVLRYRHPLQPPFYRPLSLLRFRCPHPPLLPFAPLPRLCLPPSPHSLLFLSLSRCLSSVWIFSCAYEPGVFSLPCLCGKSWASVPCTGRRRWLRNHSRVDLRSVGGWALSFLSRHS